MFDTLRHFLATDSLSPHGICLTWRPELVWTHVISDAIIGLAYFSIPVVLTMFVSRRRDIAFSWVFWSFAAFILACGTTHFMSILTLWVPDYGLEGLIKAATAAISIITAVALWPLLPKALAVPSPEQLRQVNEELRARISERDVALNALAAANAEREKAEDMLRQSQKMEAIGQFTGGVAHDFNNLLGVVMGNLERLDRRVLKDDLTSRSIEDALDASGRAAAIVRKLMAFARKQPLVPTQASVNQLVDGMMPLLSGAMQSGRIETDLQANWSVRVDTNQFENALLNLAVNARDAMSTFGTLTIRSRDVTIETPSNISNLVAGEYVALEVVDTGRGMPKTVRERAFEPFFTTKSMGQGTGLGLSQVFGFVSQSGGTVSLSSEVGAGTSVTLYLPRARAKAKPEDVTLPLTAQPGSVAC